MGVIVVMILIIAINYMVTCHGNRSTEGNETGGNVGEVGKGFEGEGGEDKWKAPREDM